MYLDSPITKASTAPNSGNKQIDYSVNDIEICDFNKESYLRNQDCANASIYNTPNKLRE